MNKTAKGLQRSSTPEQSLRSFLRTAAQKRHTLVSLISLAVFAVSGCLGLIPTLSLGIAYLLMICFVAGAMAAATFGFLAFFGGRTLRASMRRIAANGGAQAAWDALCRAKTLCGGPILLSETFLFAKGMGVAAPLSALRSVRLQAVSGKNQDVFADLYLTLAGEKREVLAMREEVGFINRGRCERAAAFLRSVIENGGKLPQTQDDVQKNAQGAARASAKELRTLLASLGEQGLPGKRNYSLWLRDKNAPEAGGIAVQRLSDNRLALCGDAATFAALLPSQPGEDVPSVQGVVRALAREKAAALARELPSLAFVLEETRENGSARVYRLTPEQLLQLEKYLRESGRMPTAQ